MYTCGLKQYGFKDYLVPVFVGCHDSSGINLWVVIL
jgi:hypothetical protein